jgi:hypothetical protein
MKKMAQGFWLLLIVAALALTACSSSKSTDNAPSTGATTPANPAATTVTTSPGATTSANPAATTVTTSPGATTPCTIPQNNGGDHDADNNGGPDDGDGCDR